MLFTDSRSPTNPPSPAVVSQEAVRRLPRWALVLLCVAYVSAGYLGREPWKSADMAAFGVMRDMALGYSSWWQPSLAGVPAEVSALLPYWLGAWAIQIGSGWLPMHLAARIPFALLLGVTLMATWYGIYYLARRPAAQPVPFAFGGEAQPTDYARCLADGGLLALIAMLGLAQLSHETTPSVVQLAGVSLLFYAAAASSYRFLIPLLAAMLACLSLALSGAPALGLGLAAVAGLVRTVQVDDRTALAKGLVLVFAGVAASAVALLLGLWPKQWGAWPTDLAAWRSLGRLFLWFTWPAWPLALISVWKWRAWVRSLHIGLPLGLLLLVAGVTLFRSSPDRILLLSLPALACLAAFALPTLQRSVTALIDWFTVLFFSVSGVSVWKWRAWVRSLHIGLPLVMVLLVAGVTLFRTSPDRILLLSLPALACLAAFALPTLQRSVTALIDWFTVLFFSVSGVSVWVVWIAMQTGSPPKIAANVQRLAPGFEISFSIATFLIAVCATLAWAWLVKWRAGRHRAALWKSLVLPAGGAALTWLLLMTLWMPLLDFARSYAPLARLVAQRMGPTECVQTLGLSFGQTAAFSYHANLRLKPLTGETQCPWLIVDADAVSTLAALTPMGQWILRATMRRPSDDNEDVLLFQRNAP